MSERCEFEEGSSRVCEYGTWGCTVRHKTEPAPATGGSVPELELLRKQNAAMKSALEGWVKYFQADIPTTEEASEDQGEAFTDCWFETQKALSQNP